MRLKSSRARQITSGNDRTSETLKGRHKRALILGSNVVRLPIVVPIIPVRTVSKIEPVVDALKVASSNLVGHEHPIWLKDGDDLLREDGAMAIEDDLKG